MHLFVHDAPCQGSEFRPRGSLTCLGGAGGVMNILFIFCIVPRRRRKGKFTQPRGQDRSLQTCAWRGQVANVCPKQRPQADQTLTPQLISIYRTIYLCIHPSTQACMRHIIFAQNAMDSSILALSQVLVKSHRALIFSLTTQK